MRFRNPMSDDHGPLRSLVEANRLESERANPLLEFRKLAGLDPYLPSLQEGELEDAESKAIEYLDKHLKKPKKGRGWWKPPHNLLLNQALMGMNLWVFGYRIGYRKDLDGLTVRPTWHSVESGQSLGHMNMSGFRYIDMDIAKKVVKLITTRPSIETTVKGEIERAEQKFDMTVPSAIASKLVKDAVKVAERRWGAKGAVKTKLYPFDGSKPRNLGMWD